MLYAIVAVLVIIADQWVKFGVQSNVALLDGGSKELIPGILSLVNVHNDGAAFSFLAGGGARIYFIILTGVFVLAVIIALATNFISGRLARWSIVLVAAGGLSNCIDRVMNGYVQDMFKTDFINFPVFNLADVFITVFCLLFVLAILFERERDEDDDYDDLYDEDEDEDLPRRPSAKERRAARVAAKQEAAEARASKKARRDREDDEYEEYKAARAARQRQAQQAQASRSAAQPAPQRPAQPSAKPAQSDDVDPFAEWERANARVQSEQRSSAPAARPAAPTAKPAQPAARPAAPASRPAAPAAKPAAPAARPAAQPAAKPAAPAARPAAQPAAKPAAPAPAPKAEAEEEFSLEDILAEFK